MKRLFNTHLRDWWKSRLMPAWCGVLGFPYFCPFEGDVTDTAFHI